MLGKLKSENLPRYLAKIDRLFPEFSSGPRIDEASIERYYRESFWGYAVFHSWAGAIHMALSKDGKFSKSDYLTQAIETEKVIQAQLSEKDDLRILEVGCGRGFNLKYLSRRFPTFDFVGVDLSDRNVGAARRDLERCSNVRIETGNFNDLSRFKQEQFDVVLAVETLCHSLDYEETFLSLSQAIKRGGALVVFDGFRGSEGHPTLDMNRAIEYTEKAMAVPRFGSTEEFVSSAAKSGFEIREQGDRSAEIMPNLIRLSDFAKAYFKVNVISRALLSALPRGLVANSVAGLLMAITVSSGAHSYWKMVFRKG